jgi:hypothetical protein
VRSVWREAAIVVALVLIFLGHLDIPVVEFPKQTVELLLVPPISIEYQSDHNHGNRRTANYARENFSRVRCNL